MLEVKHCQNNHCVHYSNHFKFLMSYFLKSYFKSRSKVQHVHYCGQLSCSERFPHLTSRTVKGRMGGHPVGSCPSLDNVHLNNHPNNQPRRNPNHGFPVFPRLRVIRSEETHSVSHPSQPGVPPGPPGAVCGRSGERTHPVLRGRLWGVPQGD